MRSVQRIGKYSDLPTKSSGLPRVMVGGLSLIAALAFAGCGSDPAGSGIPEGNADLGPDAGPPPIDGSAPLCKPPDFMVILDRTGSMSQRPDGTMPENTLAGANETKWSIAVDSLDTLARSRDETLRMGLVLFPLDPEGDQGTDCSNLDTWLEEYLPPESNDPVCLPGEMLVSPVLGAGSEIAASISRDGTGLCTYTPIGAGFNAAGDGLEAVKEPRREQYALLITDGADTCDHREQYSSKSLASADSLHEQGVNIFVLGFDGSGEGVDEAHLNHLACAGGTAPNPESNCQTVDGVLRAVDNPSPSRLFFIAENAIALDSVLEEVTSKVCCGCVVN